MLLICKERSQIKQDLTLHFKLNGASAPLLLMDANKFKISIDKEVTVNKIINPPLSDDEEFDKWFYSAISGVRDGTHNIQYSNNAETILNVTIITKSIQAEKKLLPDSEGEFMRNQNSPLRI